MPKIKDLLKLNSISKELKGRILYNLIHHHWKGDYSFKNGRTANYTTISKFFKYDFDRYEDIIDSFNWNKTIEKERYWQEIFYDVTNMNETK